ncbi:MAG: hypothetical protein GY866_16390, partial [Proteobacteria bacterium]|nr:hypothetical protein [Pseudomonadota bacterium]
MTLMELHEKLAASLSGDVLVLGPDTLNSPTILELFRTAAGSDAITLKNAIIPGPPDNELRVNGAASLWGVENASVEATFASNGELQARLEMRLPADWDFSQSLPELFATDRLADGFRPTRKNFLGEMKFDDPRFILTSTPYVDKKAGIDAAA